MQICIPTDANNFIARLDRRRQRSQGRKGKFREKHRVLGIPSGLPAPSGPKWAIRHEEAQQLSESEVDSPADEEETSDNSFSD